MSSRDGKHPEGQRGVSSTLVEVAINLEAPLWRKPWRVEGRLMAARICPYCKALSNFTLRHSWDSAIGRLAVWTCDACERAITGTRDDHGHPAEVEPKYVPTPAFPDVPEPIADDAAEAHRCFAIGAYKATASMARRAIQGAAVVKEAPDRRLFDQLDWLAEQNLITPQLAEVGHRIRVLGGDAVHPGRDGLNSISKDEAQAVLTFLDDFLRFAFQIPANLDRVVAKTPPPAEPSA